VTWLKLWRATETKPTHPTPAAGVELADAVQARRPAARALLISGYAEVETLDPALPRLSKPFKQSDLIGALAALAPSPQSSQDKPAPACAT
jgi:ActR/RegA family two-component response regulator